jgi:stage IV sporulation protein FB
MGWQDRPYYRDQRPGYGNPLSWLLYGSVPLFTAFGIRVRAHAMLIIAVVLILLFGVGFGRPVDRLIASAALFGIVLLHEFGHCFAARWVGGSADEIIMHPLGGLALASAPKRPWPTFVTVAGGPAVNIVICAITATILWLAFGVHVWNLLSAETLARAWNRIPTMWGVWVYWIHLTSWGLFVFNMLPIFPLDGGQMLQSILWPKFGYYKSMLFAAVTGIVGGVLMTAVGLALLSPVLALIGVMGVINCVNLRRMLLAEGPWGFQDEDSPYAASLGANVYTEPAKTRSKHLNKRVIKRAKQREEAERAEQEKVDQILAKVSAQGMHSLSFWEKRALKRATEKQRKREVALREEMKGRGF